MLKSKSKPKVADKSTWTLPMVDSVEAKKRNIVEVAEEARILRGPLAVNVVSWCKSTQK